MTGSSTPTRSCLKRRLNSAKDSLTGSVSSTGTGSSSESSNGSHSLCKTVSFDGHDNVFFADPDYDRHSVPVAPKLSYECVLFFFFGDFGQEFGGVCLAKPILCADSPHGWFYLERMLTVGNIRDILELKMLNVNFMCPQYKCAPVVPIGIMPLLPTTDAAPPSSASSSASHSPISSTHPSGVSIRRKDFSSPPANHYGKSSFVGLVDDETSSPSSITPPPSSPSEHSPGNAHIPIPTIATDDEGQLIFDFSAPDEAEEAAHRLADAFEAKRPPHDNSDNDNDHYRRNGHNLSHGQTRSVGVEALTSKLATVVEDGGKQQLRFDDDRHKENENKDDNVKPPFPLPPCQPTLAHASLTPSFFTLPPAAAPCPTSSPASSSSNSTSNPPSNRLNNTVSHSEESPFPFAPPVPTATIPLPALAMTLSPASNAATHARASETSTDVKPGESQPIPPTQGLDQHGVPPTSNSKTGSESTSPLTGEGLNRCHHQSSSSSSSSTITAATKTPMSSPAPPSPSLTPQASPRLQMRSIARTNNPTSGTQTQPPVAGPLAATLQFQRHPRSPQLNGLPSPSLAPPSPLSLYPPSLDHNGPLGSTSTNGFFSKRVNSSTGIGANGHVKRGSIGGARPTSPAVKPLKS